MRYPILNVKACNYCIIKMEYRKFFVLGDRLKKNSAADSQAGFSLTEIMVAMGIFSIVLFGAMNAYNFFTRQTSKEFKKMDNISEFNQLTKDLIKFTDGAGISTSYLNLPVKVKGCDYDTENGWPKEPCLMKVVDGKLVPPKDEEIPSQLKGCTQFYKDGRGSLVARRAYPGRARNDLVNVIEDKNVKPDASVELVAAWPLIDENSPPFLMLKSKEGGIYLSMLKGPPSEISRITNTANDNVKHSFFEYNVIDPDPAVMANNIENVKKLINVPFLIYNTFMTNHYTIQYAADIISCHLDPSACQKLLVQTSRDPNGTGSFERDIPNPSAPPATIKQSNDAALSADLDTKYPTNVFAVEFKAIDLNEPFFADIFKNQKLPSTCLSAWDVTKQGASEYFFPSKAYSVFVPGTTLDDIGGTDPLNVLHLSHYYTGLNLTGMSGSTAKGVMAAVPIDILTYRTVLSAGSTPENKSVKLVARRWYAGGITEDKDAIRIPVLKNPFMITRRIGSSEMGMWYNPVETKPTPAGKAP